MAGGVNQLLCHRLSETPLRIAPFNSIQTGADVPRIASPSSMTASPSGGMIIGSPVGNVTPTETYKYRGLSKRKMDAVNEQQRRKIYVDCLGKLKRKLSLLLDDKRHHPKDVAQCIDEFVAEDFGIIPREVRLQTVNIQCMAVHLLIGLYIRQ